jgi:hypothetical protein
METQSGTGYVSCICTSLAHHPNAYVVQTRLRIRYLEQEDKHVPGSEASCSWGDPKVRTVHNGLET